MKKCKLTIVHLILFCIVLFGIIAIVLYKRPTPAPTPPPSYIPQFVLISFDGSKSIDIWKDIRALKDEMKASGTPIHVTQFINTAYFLTGATRDQYEGPGQERGQTNIGVSDGIEDIRARINAINNAVLDGDEIAVHTTGHFSGLRWQKEDWIQELASFNPILFGLNTMYRDARLPSIQLKPADIIGFRAPYLDRNANLYSVLHELPHFSYDSSEVGDSVSWPKKDARGLWHIPLGTIEYGAQKSRVLAMDYNIYFRDSQAQDTIKTGTPEWQRVYTDTLNGFLGYFTRNYHGTRAPVLVGYHFQKWNDGVYWEALKAFAHQVCGQKEVKCGTFKELVSYLNTQGVPKVEPALIEAARTQMPASVLQAIEEEGNE